MQVPMKSRKYLVLCTVIVFLFVLTTSVKVQAQPGIKYAIQLNSDGSADWTITSEANGTSDSWIGFQEKVNALVASAAAVTQRSMSVQNNTFQMVETNINSNVSETNYTFAWLNFCQAKNAGLSVGDVFNVPNFFEQLYGDGQLQITYPSNCTMQQKPGPSPPPDSVFPSSQTLQWMDTQFLETGQPNFILDFQKTAVTDSSQPPFVLIGLLSAAAVSITAFASWFFVKNRRTINSNAPTPAITKTVIETEEEKVLRVIRSSGGTTFQAAITEKCNFSKAKTSQLLSALEAKGVVRRYKRGRDKIVDVVEQSKR